MKDKTTLLVIVKNQNTTKKILYSKALILAFNTHF